MYKFLNQKEKKEYVCYCVLKFYLCAMKEDSKFKLLGLGIIAPLSGQCLGMINVANAAQNSWYYSKTLRHLKGKIT